VSRQGYVVGILGFALLNGMFSPILLPQTTAAVLLLSPGLLISSPHIVAFVAYVLGSTFTIMLGGVPAALYEHVTGLSDSNSVSLWIWLVCTALLALPAVISFLGVGGF
jgi:hypothetical protein